MILVSSHDVAARLESFEAGENRRYAEAWSWLDPSSRASSLPVAGGWCVFTGPDSPMTQAVGLGMLGEVTAAHLDALEDFFFRRGAAASVGICPLAHPSLAGGLAARGYTPRGFEQVMVREVDAEGAPGGALAVEPERAGAWGTGEGSRVEVRPVTGAEGELWARVVARGFADGRDPGRMELLLARLSLLIEGTRCYLVWLGEEPVAGGAMVVRDDVAHLLGDVTLPAHRGRGAQSELVRHRVREAALAGCRLITAGVRPGGGSQRNFERHGFLVAYTRLTVGRNAPSGYTPAT